MKKESKVERSDGWLSQQMKYADERIAGVDLIAFGENPNWKLAISSNGDLSFNTETSFGNFEASGVEGIQPQDLNAMTYGALSEVGTISMMVFSDSCLASSEIKFPKRIKISAKKGEKALQSFNGCGLYLNDPALHDIWAVKSWKGLGGEKGVPQNAFIEFNMKTQRIYGNLGCGDLSGYFSPMGSKLKLYALDYTDKLCPEDGSSMALFNHLNFKTHTIHKADVNLQLIAEGDTITFLKVD